RSIANLLAAIAASRSQPLHRLLAGLSIRHVGWTVAELLARHFKTLERLPAASEEELVAVDGIGPTIASSVHAWFATDRNRHLLRRLAEAGGSTRAEGQPDRSGERRV